MGAADLIQGWGQMGESPPTIFPCYKRALAIPALGNFPLGVTAALFTGLSLQAKSGVAADILIFPICIFLFRNCLLCFGIVP